MSILALDLGGTKLSIALLSSEGAILMEKKMPLQNRKGGEVGSLIALQVQQVMASQKEGTDSISSIGIAVPGISHDNGTTVWAPNIPGWEAYPLLEEIRKIAESIPVLIDSDRACCILGEVWKGAAIGCRDAIFLTVGTGIGAGILVNGNVLRGAQDIAGSVGWMALERPFKEKYNTCGCFESRASGDGIAKLAREVLTSMSDYDGSLTYKLPDQITAYDIFRVVEENDPLANEVLRQCIELWGMGVANLVSIFNPELIIMGGGIFGPAIKFIDRIREEANRWAQPVSIKNLRIEPSALGDHAALFGAGLLALQNSN